MTKQLILVHGPTASGKSSVLPLVKEVSGFGYIAKDDIKELLFDTVGTPASRDESRAYGKAAIIGMFTIARLILMEKSGLIIECVFKPELAMQDIGDLTDGLDVDVRQIYVTAAAEIRQQRYRERVAAHLRHPGHGDRQDRPLSRFIDDLQENAPLPGLPTLIVDTTNAVDAEIVQLIADFLR